MKLIASQSVENKLNIEFGFGYLSGLWLWLNVG